MYDMVDKYAIYKPGSNARYISIRDGNTYDAIITGYVTKIGWNNNFIIAEENYENYCIIEVETNQI